MLIDEGKYKYRLDKAAAEQKKKNKKTVLKELRFHINTEEHDIATKVRHAREFLEDGATVKIAVNFVGREITHKEFGYTKINDIVSRLQDVGQIDSPIKLEMKQLSCTLRSKKK